MKTPRIIRSALALSIVITAIFAEYSLANAPDKQYAVSAKTIYDTYTQADAQTSCKNLTFENESWHVPTTKELLAIVDDTQAIPSMGVNAFPPTTSVDFWTFLNPNANVRDGRLPMASL